MYGLASLLLAWFYLAVLPRWQGRIGVRIAVSPWVIAKSIVFFLGVPLAAFFLITCLVGLFVSRAFGLSYAETTAVESRFI